jgi:uncharacterized protein (DUF2132 family)
MNTVAKGGVTLPTELEKLQAYASHLLDDMIRLREKYAMLEPMLFDQDVAGTWGAGQRAKGFVTLQGALFFSCAQDAAKIATDRDNRVPSLHNILAKLDKEDLREELREEFADWKLTINEDDPSVAAALKRMELREGQQRREKFDALYAELVSRWKTLKKSAELEGLQTIRDKISAHTELRCHVNEYKRVDLSGIGLKWGDLKRVIQELQELVELTGALVRNASFAWEMLDEQLSGAATSFWEPHVSRDSS